MEKLIQDYSFPLATLILGWLLGIIGNAINEKLKRKLTKTDIKAGIKSEISELQIHLTGVCLMSVCQTGGFNREVFNWIKPHFLKFFESAEFIIPENIRRDLPALNEISDEMWIQLITTAYVRNSPGTNPISFTYQNVSIPYIDLMINNMPLFTNKIQKLLFILKRDISFINGDINQVWFYHAKTFNNPTQNNLMLLNTNLNNLYARIYRRSKIMVDNIEKILEQLEKK